MQSGYYSSAGDACTACGFPYYSFRLGGQGTTYYMCNSSCSYPTQTCWLGAAGWTNPNDSCVWYVFNPTGVSPGVGGIVDVRSGGSHCRYKFVTAPACTDITEVEGWYCTQVYESECWDTSFWVSSYCQQLTVAEAAQYPICDPQGWPWARIVGGPWCSQTNCTAWCVEQPTT